MIAAALWRPLGQAGVELEVEEGSLEYDAPVGVVTPALVEQIRTEKTSLLAVVSGRFRTELRTWAPEHRDRYEERAAILEHEAGLSRPEAERAAYLERREATAAESAVWTAAENEELCSRPGWAQGCWSFEAEHRAAQGASRLAAERQAFEVLRKHLLREAPVLHDEEPPRCPNPRCEGGPDLLGLRACPDCRRARQGIGPQDGSRCSVRRCRRGRGPRRAARVRGW